jgi:hypothetical protein
MAREDVHASDLCTNEHSYVKAKGCEPELDDPLRHRGPGEECTYEQGGWEAHDRDPLDLLCLLIGRLSSSVLGGNSRVPCLRCIGWLHSTVSLSLVAV